MIGEIRSHDGRLHLIVNAINLAHPDAMNLIGGIGKRCHGANAVGIHCLAIWHLDTCNRLPTGGHIFIRPKIPAMSPAVFKAATVSMFAK